ncbi:MAG: hypothetical protein HY814_01865 [Candidatus Riflebacteria bacterium]|nr:hypothetical protein [Candidatus Riflebacteria bacterium]
MPGELRAQAVGPSLIAGERLDVAVMGCPGGMGTLDRGAVLGLRHGRQRCKLQPDLDNSTVALEDGPLAVEAHARLPAPAADGTGFYVLLSRGP